MKEIQMRTNYVLVIDSSSSMSGMRQETEDGIKEQIKEIQDLQKEFPDQEFKISLITFANKVNVLFSNADPSQVPDFKYQPSGMTAMYDGIGEGISLMRKVKDTPEDTYLFVIFTDGMENNSREWSGKVIGETIKELENTQKWTFTFMGANIDVERFAASVNIDTSNVHTYEANARGMMDAMNVVAASTSSRSRSFAATKTFKSKGFYKKSKEEDTPEEPKS